jgi:hypothetical protein
MADCAIYLPSNTCNNASLLKLQRKSCKAVTTHRTNNSQYVKLCLLSGRKLLILYCLQEEGPLCHVLQFPSIMNSCLLPAPTTSALQTVTAVNGRWWRQTCEILFRETANWQIKHTPLYTRTAVPQCACVDASSLHRLMGSSCCRSHTDMASPLWINEKPSVFWEKKPGSVITRMEQGYLCACACVSAEV